MAQCQQGSKKGLFRDTGNGYLGALCTAIMDCEGTGEKGQQRGHTHVRCTNT